MLPRLFHYGNYFLPTYGVLVAIGLIVALIVIARNAKKVGIDPDDAWDLGILLIISGVLGAKVMMVAVDWDFYSHHPWQILSTFGAGGVFSGGVVGALLAGTWYVRHKRMSWLKT